MTGAGGCIGSALTQALAATGDATLILLDASEQNLFEIHRTLDDAHVPHETILGSVTHGGLLNGIFTRFRPRAIYHAAAVKHVPLLELNPLAAVHNNAMGTYALAQAAMHHGAESLILVSTDKAVYPRSIMGASKRVAELIVTALGMNAVRLGNVYGSTGSAVPIFREQIAKGGPVTVTHPDATRYFMPVAEAVQAILSAGAAECEGRVLLPDLGTPRRIVDLARELIGDAAVEIEFIGMRPGEKLREDLVYESETREGHISGLQVMRTPGPSAAELHEHMARLACLLANNDLAGVIDAVRTLVPEYQPSRSIAR